MVSQQVTLRTGVELLHQPRKRGVGATDLYVHSRRGFSFNDACITVQADVVVSVKNANGRLECRARHDAAFDDLTRRLADESGREDIRLALAVRIAAAIAKCGESPFIIWTKCIGAGFELLSIVSVTGASIADGTAAIPPPFLRSPFVNATVAVIVDIREILSCRNACGAIVV